MKVSECRGNFELGEGFPEVRCIHGHPVRIFNLHRDHWVACDTCQTCMVLGGNLMSSWKQENEAIWQRNRESLKGYRVVE